EVELSYPGGSSNGACDDLMWSQGWFYFVERHSTGEGIYRVRPSHPQHQEEVLRSNMYMAGNLAPSPDGKWLFYQLDYISAVFFHLKEQRFLHFDIAGVDSCSQARWSPNSRYLLCAG